LKEMATIKIEKHVRDKLKRLGRKGESYSEIIERLIAEVEQ